MFDFYTPWKRQGFLSFSGGIDMEHWAKMASYSCAWVEYTYPNQKPKIKKGYYKLELSQLRD